MGSHFPASDPFSFSFVFDPWTFAYQSMYRRVPSCLQRPGYHCRYYVRPRRDGKAPATTPKPTTGAKDGIPRVPSELPVHPTTGNPDWKSFFSVKGWRDRWFIANQQTAREIVGAMNLDDGGPPKVVIEAYPGVFPPPSPLPYSCCALCTCLLTLVLDHQVLEWSHARCLNCRRVW